MADFTPGPWRYFMGDICVEGSDGDDRIIAGIGKSCGARSSVYSTISNHRPEGIANANLIAAAPDLLEALELWLKYNDEDGETGVQMMLNYDAALFATRKAISKAKGDK